MFKKVKPLRMQRLYYFARVTDEGRSVYRFEDLVQAAEGVYEQCRSRSGRNSRSLHSSDRVNDPARKDAARESVRATRRATRCRIVR
jgi:hypothetical protein